MSNGNPEASHDPSLFLALTVGRSPCIRIHVEV
jgi:hypothetical protein